MTPHGAPVDARMSRFDQGVLALALVVGFVFGVPHVVPLWAAFLALSACGVRYGPWPRLYAALLAPRLAPPDAFEDPRPARFCAGLGAATLGLAGVAFLTGWGAVGWALALLVGGHASLASVGGLCLGAQLHARLEHSRAEGGPAPSLGDG